MRSDGLMVVMVVMAVAMLSTSAGASGAMGNSSWPMMLSNAQRNGQSGAGVVHGPTPNMTILYTSLSGNQFVHSPVYSAEEETVYFSTFTGFVMAVDAWTGATKWRVCLGKTGPFPGMPCKGINGWQNLPYGQPTLLSNGNVLVQHTQSADEKPDVLACLDKDSGDVLWTYTLSSCYDPDCQGTFLNLVTPVPSNVSGVDWIVFYGQKNDPFGKYQWAAMFTVLDSLTGAELVSHPWLEPQNGLLFPPHVYDPSSGHVITQFTNDLQPECTDSYSDYMLCTGVGAFDLQGNHIWNQTMLQSYAYGSLALDPELGVIHVPSSQLSVFSYTVEGQIRWKIDMGASSDSILFPSVCPGSGIVVYPTRDQTLSAYDAKVTYPKKPVWEVDTNGDPSVAVAVTADGYIVYMEGDSVTVRDCDTGKLLWTKDYGSDESFTNPVAIGTLGGMNVIFASVYRPDVGGVLIRLNDPSSLP